MKKIMKKALSLMLALVMMFSLAPMTANAMITYGEGTEASPYILSGTDERLTVDANTKLYYSVQMQDANPVDFEVAGNGEFIVTIYNGDMSVKETYESENGVAKAIIQGSMSTRGMAYFSIENKTNELQVYLTKAVIPAGYSESNPAELVIGSNEADCSKMNYYYSYTATEAGALTITLAEQSIEECDWEFQVNVVPADEDNYAAYYYGDMHYSDVLYEDGDGITTETVNVNVGDVVKIRITDYYSGVIGVIASFAEGQVTPTPTPTPTPDPTPTPNPEEEESNYEWGNAIVVGDNALEGPSSYLYTYTVHEFAPNKVGVYTFTTTDSAIGIVSNNGNWITVKLPEEEYPNQNSIPYTAVTETTFVWECTHEAQSIWIAVMPNANEANITVEWEELVVEEIESENAYPTVSLETYTFDGDLDKLESLMYGLADEKVDFALGEDGFFHVADVKDFDENGDYIGKKPLEELPVVLVKLNDSVVSLQSAIGYGNVKWVSYGEDEDGNPVAEYIIYFNDMITEYLTYAATDAKLYPLTEDLLYTMILVGADQGWYVEDGAVQYVFANDKVPEELLFTFAMYYLNQDVVTLDKEEPVVDKDAMTDIIANNQAGKDTVINSTTKNEAGEEVTIKFEFAAGTMKPVDGKTEYTFEVSLVEKIDDATAEKAEIKKDTFVLGVSFEYDGKLPAKATITIPVPAAYANKTLYYYEVLADGTLKYVCDAPVDANGNAKVTQDHCSDYVLLSEKLVEELPEAPKTGDTTNFALWIAILGLGVVAIAGSVVMKKREF